MGKESACNAGDSGLIPGLGRSPEKGEGYPLQYSMDRGAWEATVLGVAWLNFIKCLFFFNIYGDFMIFSVFFECSKLR